MIFSKKREDKVNEELKKLYEESVADVQEGQLLKGKIVQITDKDILIDVGYKSEGVIHKSEVTSPEDLSIGDEIDVKVMKIDDQGRVNLSRKALMGDEAKDRQNE